MIGIELRRERSKAEVIDNCARSIGNLNRNPYCSWSHSTPIPSWTMKRNERDGEMGCGWRWEVVSFCSVLPLIHELLCIGCVRFFFVSIAISSEWGDYSLWLYDTLLLLFNLFFHSVLDSVVIVALYFLYQMVILLLSWCCVLLSSSFVVYWEWGLYSQVVHSDRVGYLESLSTCCSVIECIWHEI